MHSAFCSQSRSRLGSVGLGPLKTTKSLLHTSPSRPNSRASPSRLLNPHLIVPPLRSQTVVNVPVRTFRSSRKRSDFHFDTHHFVQRLEREGLNRAQAEGIMTAIAEVIDESIRNMTSNMVTKADQEKVGHLTLLSKQSPVVCTSRKEWSH